MRALILLGAGLIGCGPGGRGPVVPVKVVAPIPIAASIQLRVDAWTRLSTATSGKAVESKEAKDVPVLIKRIFDEGIPEGPVDLVFVVDATGSMIDDVDAVKADMRQILAHLRERNPDSRVGVVVYRDIHDQFLTRTLLALDTDAGRIEHAIASISVDGGDDWREHVYAGITTALTGQPWRPTASQHIMLMGDAPPHDDYGNDPRTYESVTTMARTAPLHVRIHTIGIKCDATCEQALTRESEEAARRGKLLPL
ncbi:MAG TPA: vWA domain-containing protein [Kofleriaceae bacterium]|nr:vWA domain-containing protein [Kofleriaceae bacterium]